MTDDRGWLDPIYVNDKLTLERATHTANVSRSRIRETYIRGVFAGDNREVALARCVNVKSYSRAGDIR